jgi:hypothetical protein
MRLPVVQPELQGVFAMHPTTDKKYQARKDRDQWLFRLLISLAVIWFFARAVLSKFTMGWVEGCDTRESCLHAAIRNAYSTVPYVFMRV